MVLCSGIPEYYNYVTEPLICPDLLIIDTCRLTPWPTIKFNDLKYFVIIQRAQSKWMQEGIIKENLDIKRTSSCLTSTGKVQCSSF